VRRREHRPADGPPHPPARATVCSFWPEGDLDGLPVKGLALGDYTLWPLWVWIYCLIWWIIQV
jgi:hypothetical protein